MRRISAVPHSAKQNLNPFDTSPVEPDILGMYLRLGLNLFLCWVAVAAHGEGRVWTRSCGESIEAEFVKLEKETLHLKKGEKAFQLPLESFSQDDRDYVAEQVEEEQEKTPFSLETKISATSLKADEIADKPVVLHQWVAHCKNCPPTLKAFEKMAERHKKSATFLVWHSSDSLTMAREKIQELDLKLPVYHGDRIEWDKKFGEFTWPYVILLSKGGEVLYMGKQDQAFEKALKAASK